MRINKSNTNLLGLNNFFIKFFNICLELNVKCLTLNTNKITNYEKENAKTTKEPAARINQSY